MIRLSFFVVLLLLSPVSLYGQAGSAAARIDDAAGRASASGIPRSLLEAKVAEGRAKGVPEDRIAIAVERRLELLLLARDVFEGLPVTPADLSVAADALGAGVSQESVGALGRATPAGHRAVALAVLTQLVQEGFSSGRALQRVRAALARGPEELRSLPSRAGSPRADRSGPAMADGGARPKGVPAPGRGGVGAASGEGGVGAADAGTRRGGKP